MSKWHTKVSENPDRALCLALIVAGAIYAIFHVYTIISKLSFGVPGIDPGNGSDFFVFYSAARFIWEGGPAAALYDMAALKDFQMGLGASAAGIHPFNYPPTYIFIVLPLALLFYAPALLAWQLATAVCLALAAWLAGLRRLEILALMVAPTAMVNVSAGQNGFLTSALLIGGLALIDRRPLIAGTLFGLLTFKPHLGLLIPIALLARRNWRVIFAAAAATGVLAGSSLIVFGPDAWAMYLSFAGTFRHIAETQADNTFMTYSATALMGARVAGLSPGAAYTIQALLSLAVGVIVYWIYSTAAEPSRRLPVLLSGVILASPFGFLYDLPVLSLAIILLARRGLREGFLPYERLALLAGWLMPFLGSLFSEMGVPLAPLVALAVFAIAVRRALPLDSPRRTRPAAPGARFAGAENAGTDGSLATGRAWRAPEG
jgi:hypothetical protein